MMIALALTLHLLATRFNENGTRNFGGKRKAVVVTKNFHFIYVENVYLAYLTGGVSLESMKYSSAGFHVLCQMI